MAKKPAKKLPHRKGDDPNPPGHPVGEAIDWTEAELARLSAVTDADVGAAKRSFRAKAPPAIRDLLDAPADE